MSKRIVAVFCGAGGKMSDQYMKLAFDVGYKLAANGYNLVTGGANVGMMKEVVDGHIKGDTQATRHGVLPEIFRQYNINHTGILAEHMVWPESVHGRLQSFHQLADDIVVLPGGFGTLHELIDCLVHIQFNLISKRIFLVNFNKFWDPMLQMFNAMVLEAAVQQKHVDNLNVVTNSKELIQSLLQTNIELAQGLEVERWQNK